MNLSADMEGGLSQAAIGRPYVQSWAEPHSVRLRLIFLEGQNGEKRFGRNERRC